MKIKNLLALLFAVITVFSAVPAVFAAEAAPAAVSEETAGETEAEPEEPAVPDPLPLAKITALSNTASGVKMTWSKVAGTVKYRIYYKTASKDWTKIGDTTATSYTWKKAASGTKYTFAICPIDSAGNLKSPSGGKSITYIATPAKPKVTNVAATGIKIAWSKVTGAAKYRIYYKTTGGWKKLVDTKSTSYTWKKAKLGTKYTFTVRCINSAGQSTSSYNATGASCTRYLATPTKLSATKTSGTTVKISWKKVTGAAKYRIYYKTTGSWKKLTDTKKTSYTWKKAKKGTTYRFTVRCVSSNGKTATSKYNTTGAPAVLSIKELARYSYFKKYMTDAQFKKAYNAAVKIVAPLQGRPKKEQLQEITTILRKRFDAGMNYSMSAAHYNDPYGYLVLKTASCAGCVRTTGLCLNILGINYEHVHENKYCHQWARVKVGSQYWISDAFGLYCGKEPAAKKHPYLS